MKIPWPEWLVGKGNKDNTVIVPPGRTSLPDIQQSFEYIKDAVAFVAPDFEYQYIPVIRKLLKSNSSVSLAANSIVELANTGFEMKFSNNVTDEEDIKMREHLKVAFKRWGVGTAGIHGIINKWIYQIYVAGAISTEWVIKDDLKGIAYPAILNPESIRTAFDYSAKDYRFYQVPMKLLLQAGKTHPNANFQNYIKLNPLTYQYIAFFTDQEKPIGIPPFISALDDVQAQLKMLRNIGYVSDQLGLMGFLEFLMEKPSSNEGEGKEAYRTRLNSLLSDSKVRIKDGLKDGIVAGFKTDHEFNFHSSTKDTAGVADIFDINHRMVANGLFMSPQFLGGISTGSEALLTVVFTKMLSQLNNIHLGIKEVLERGIFLELSLKGFKNPEVECSFKPSTITDKLKIEQSREIQIRNLVVLYKQGIISQVQFAKEIGYDGPDEDEPREDPQEVIDGAVSQEKKEKDKDTGDRKGRDKAKPQPKRNDRKPNPR